MAQMANFEDLQKKASQSEDWSAQYGNQITRIAVLAIFAYILHLFVIRQRIHQLLEEHCQSRSQSLRMLIEFLRGRKVPDVSKLFDELVKIVDASPRIPPQPPAPPLSKIVDAVNATIKKAAGK